MQFSPTKKQMVKFVEIAFDHFQSLGRKIKYIRMDGGGENEPIKLLCKRNGATVEQTPPHTPQYNGKIERRFAVLISMGMCLLWRFGLWWKHVLINGWLSGFLFGCCAS